MPEVQRSRFERWLKNLTGFRGPLGLSVDQGIAPTYDFSRLDAIELDDEQAFWYGSLAQGAVAGQFSFVQIACSSGRAVVDSLWIRQMNASGIRIGMSFSQLAGAANPSCVRNLFLGSTGTQLGVVTFNASSQVADPFATGCILTVDQQAAGGVAQNIREQFVIAPGRFLTISPGSVNLAVSVSGLGRWLADQT